MVVASVVKSEPMNLLENYRKAYGSYQELALDPELDVVYIGTPYKSIFPMQESVLSIKAVLRKPITLNQRRP